MVLRRGHRQRDGTGEELSARNWRTRRYIAIAALKSGAVICSIVAKELKKSKGAP